ncbi:MAG: DUF421 domain-containing protein [Bythopirellula sp.]|nr:DUF421 domain-containing protein [Bythopirellula sp.]
MAIIASSDYSFDWYRLLLGEHPPIYILEIVLRVVLIYFFTLLLLRWSGKRTIGEITFFDFAIIIALGTAVGDGMIYDDTPLIHSFIVIFGVLALQRFMAKLTEKNELLENLIEGKSTLIVENGVIRLDKLHEESLSQEELFESLRYEGIHQLGQVALAYLEPTGKMSVIKNTQERPGLSVLPEGRRLLDSTDHEVLCCKNCGCLAEQQEKLCQTCGNHEWQKATLTDS